MARLRGTGLGAGMAMGSTAVVRVQSGVPLMPEPPARITALAAQRKLTETPEVILVADELRTALAIAASLPWARVAGIATEREAPDAATPPIPTVTGIAGLMQAAADDVLILVDATRGTVLVDPDPIYLAQYTAEHDRVAPKNRIFLDEQHLPAKTLDGRTITVIADASAGVEEANRCGPDALLYALPVLFDAVEVRRLLFELLAAAAGKPLLLPYNGSLPLQPILEAAARADLTLIVSPQPGDPLPAPAAIGSLMEEAEATEADCDRRDVICALPRVAAEVDLRTIDPLALDELELRIERLVGAGVTRLIATADWDEDGLELLGQLGAVVGPFLMPIYCALDAARTSEEHAHIVRLLIGAGTAGLVVAPSLVNHVKVIVRAADTGGCANEWTLSRSSERCAVTLSPPTPSPPDSLASSPGEGEH